MNSGKELIARERERQKSKEGWSKAHDDEHYSGELALAGDCYRSIYAGYSDDPPARWPWDAEWWKPTSGDEVQRLVKSGALYQAEIDRLTRLRRKVEGDIDRKLAGGWTTHAKVYDREIGHKVIPCIWCEGEQPEGFICDDCGATADGRGNMVLYPRETEEDDE